MPAAVAAAGSPMDASTNRKVLHDLFLASIWAKGAVGLLQVVGGTMLGLVSRDQLTRLAVLVTRPELAEDPGDSIARFVQHSAEQFGHGTQVFASLYLVAHGLVKIVLVVALLRRQMWSYPASLWILGGFIGYQSWRYAQTHSPWLVLLTALDILVVALVWREWRLRKSLGFHH